MVKSNKEKKLDYAVEYSQVNEKTQKPEMVKESGTTTVKPVKKETKKEAKNEAPKNEAPKKAPVQREKSAYIQYLSSDDCKKAYEKFKKNLGK